MSNPSLSETPRVFRKPRADVYTMLLFASLVALIIGCVCLWLEANPVEYSDKPYTGAPTVSISPGACDALCLTGGSRETGLPGA